MATANLFVPSSITVGRELAEVTEQLRRATVVVCGDSGRGSGVIWRPDGFIVTNAHVATSARHTVQLADSRAFDAELLRRDRQLDLALLRITAAGLPSAQWRDPGSLRAGELVVAIGNPLDAAGALAVGVISTAPKAGDTFMRADIRLVPGNSGGPLADVEGKVVGINSMVVAGIGIAVSSAIVEQFVAEDRRIGVTLRPVVIQVQRRTALGLIVIELEPGGRAHLSGVLVGDVIVRSNGEWLASPGQLSHDIRTAAQAVSLDVLRAGRLQVCEITVARKSAAEVA